MSFTPQGVQFLYNADLDTGPALWINGTPTGFTDSYVGVFSCAVKYQEPHLLDSERYPIFTSVGRDFQLVMPAADEAALNVERVFLMLEIGTPIGSDWAITIDTPGILDGECHHLQISWDANHATNQKLVSAAWDGAPATVVENDDGRNAELVRMGSITSFSVGMWPEYQSQATLSLAEFYLDNTVYIDFTDQANIDKFYQSDTGFADLGTDGSTPTGTQPLMYYSVRSAGVANDFLTNLGSSNDLTNGAGFGSDPLILVDVFCPGGTDPDPDTAPRPQLKYGIDPATPLKALANERLVRAKWAAIEARNAMEERDRQLEYDKRQQEKKRRKEAAERERMRLFQLKQWQQRLEWLKVQDVFYDEEAIAAAIAEAEGHIKALMEKK